MPVHSLRCLGLPPFSFESFLADVEGHQSEDSMLDLPLKLIVNKKRFVFLHVSEIKGIWIMLAVDKM